jgi:hypothetical protein
MSALAFAAGSIASGLLGGAASIKQGKADSRALRRTAGNINLAIGETQDRFKANRKLRRIEGAQERGQIASATASSGLRADATTNLDQYSALSEQSSIDTMNKEESWKIQQLRAEQASLMAQAKDVKKASRWKAGASVLGGLTGAIPRD